MQVIEKLLDMAEPGGLHEHTMLLVFGDHGQTLTGDHGGGAPEEVDTAIFALHMGAYFQFRYRITISGTERVLLCMLLV